MLVVLYQTFYSRTEAFYYQFQKLAYYSSSFKEGFICMVCFYSTYLFSLFQISFRDFFFFYFKLLFLQSRKSFFIWHLQRKALYFTVHWWFLTLLKWKRAGISFECRVYCFFAYDIKNTRLKLVWQQGSKMLILLPKACMTTKTMLQLATFL